MRAPRNIYEEEFAKYRVCFCEHVFVENYVTGFWSVDLLPAICGQVEPRGEVHVDDSDELLEKCVACGPLDQRVVSFFLRMNQERLMVFDPDRWILSNGGDARGALLRDAGAGSV
ncbi:hypothetical protein A2U01_0029627 [Trifolium medium]|uniref:Uncharacterized protein n=1 Tax=Trifolium medium TaxID=97028 RepID=A0A392PAT1_9FABA|nr:hypothetical protein [Trifolium medium]